MKKVFVAVAIATAVVASATAQNKYKPDGMSFSAEINYSFGSGSINTGTGDWDNGGFELPKYGAKFRLFINDAWAVRLNFGLGTDATKTTNYITDPADNNKEYETTGKTSVTRFSIMPGFEYHFNKFERVSPYVGAEIGLLTQNTKTTEDNDEAQYHSTVKQPGLGFAFNVVTGFDVYLCKGLYMGCELGLGYESMNNKRGSSKIETGNSTVETDGNRSTLDSFFGFHATPSLRIGWHF